MMIIIIQLTILTNYNFIKKLIKKNREVSYEFTLD